MKHPKIPRVALFILAPFAIAGFIAIGGTLVAWLWNTLLPPLFGLPAVSFWQALGLLLLARILFGGFSGGGSRGGSSGRKRERLTPEEVARVRQALNPAANEAATKESVDDGGDKVAEE
jgi:hypothetical protein